MTFKGVTAKLWLAMVTLVLLVLGSFSLALNFLFASFYTNQALSSLEQDAKDMSTSLSSVKSQDELQTQISNVRYTQGIIAYVVDDNGEIRAFSTGGMSMGMGMGMGMGMSINLGLTSFTEDDLTQVISGHYLSQTITAPNGTSLVLAAAPLKLADGKLTWALILTRPLSPVTESIRSFRRLLYYVSGIALILATVFGLWLSRTLTTPLVEMKRIARRMSERDFSARLKVTTNDEIGELGTSLNLLAEDLDKHIKLLSRQKEQLGGILASMGDAVITLDEEGNLVQANPPALDLWDGHPERRELIVGKLLEALHLVRQQAKPVTVDLELGTQVLNVHMEPLKEVEGQGGGVAVLRDVTAGRRQEKLRRELMAQISHELRTPIHLVQGQLEALADGLVPPKDQRGYLETALLEVQRLGRLVGDLQEINRLEQGFPIVQDLLDLGVLAKEVTERYKPKAEGKRINLEVSQTETIISGDRDRLTQVIANLLENSLRYTPEGGRIKIDVCSAGNQAVMTVSDTGKGIAPGHLPYIWESFFRGDPSSKSHMGLGLTIVKRIVEAHGGAVAVSSEQGQGTKFTITIPLVEKIR